MAKLTVTYTLDTGDDTIPAEMQAKALQMYEESDEANFGLWDIGEGPQLVSIEVAS